VDQATLLDFVNEVYVPGMPRTKVEDRDVTITPDRFRGGIIVGHDGKALELAWDDEVRKWVPKA